MSLCRMVVFITEKNFLETQTWGNIFDGVTDPARYDELRKPAAVDEKCAECPFLPVCTPFYKNGCLGYFEKCYEYRRLATEHGLHHILEGETSEDVDEEL